jgi:dolichol-phosphate mannosyltransferase
MSLELSVVLPAYREAVALNQLLPALTASVSQLTASYEVLVIDSQEPLDDTEAVCRRFGMGHVRRTGGNLYGDAVRTGIAKAQGRYILLMDADGSHNPAHIQRLWRERDHFDVVIGSRYVEGGHTENPPILIFMSWMVNLVFRLLFGPHCKDMSNSFRLYRAELLKPLRLRCSNFDIVEEILILLSGNRIKEVPVTFEQRKAGHSKRNLVVFAFGYAWTLTRLFWIRLSR